MSVKFCLALLALSSLTAAADPDCEGLIKPLEDRSKLPGKWIYIAGTTDNKELMEELKMVNSSWIELSPIPGSADMTLRWGDKVDEKCIHGSTNSTSTGNTTTVTFHFNSTTREHVGKHLVTCPDCILWTDDFVTEDKNTAMTRKGRNLYLFSKTGALDASHLEEFKKQAACLNFPAEFHFGETTDLCPDAADAKEEEQ